MTKHKKCWDCANLGPCTVLSDDCKNFVRYNYGGRPASPCSTAAIAKLCNVHPRTVLRWLRKDAESALQKIEELTGLQLEYKPCKSGKSKNHRLMPKEVRR